MSHSTRFPKPMAMKSGTVGNDAFASVPHLARRVGGATIQVIDAANDRTLELAIRVATTKTATRISGLMSAYPLAGRLVSACAAYAFGPFARDAGRRRIPGARRSR